MKIKKDLSKSDVGKDMRKIPTREEFHQQIASPILTNYDFETGKANYMATEASKASQAITWTKYTSKLRKNNAGNWLKEHGNGSKENRNKEEYNEERNNRGAEVALGC